MRKKIPYEVSARKLKGISVQEPVIRENNYNVDLGRAFIWYDCEWKESDYRSALNTYLEQNNLTEYKQSIEKATLFEFRSTAVLAYLLSRGQYLQDRHIESIRNKLDTLKSKYGQTKKVKQNKVEVQPVAVQSRVVSVSDTIAGELDLEIDKFLTSNGKHDFSIQSFLSKHQVTSTVAKKIPEYFTSLVDELSCAINNADDQVVESYAHMSRAFLNKFKKFIMGIISGCEQHAILNKPLRKARVRKAKPVGIVVQKLKFMREFKPLNLKSVDPTKLVGASEAWLYDTQKRKLVLIKAADGFTLTVKGTSILNYDVTVSGSKTIRKPEQLFSSLQSTAKRVMNNTWKSIKSKVSKISARTNEHMIIVAVN